MTKTAMKTTGYAYFRDGKIHGFDLTKRGLLIGYDMMPLIGLRCMERRLLKRGTIQQVRLVVDLDGDWGATKDGVPVLKFASWQGGLSETKKRCLSSLAGFVLSELRDDATIHREPLYRLWMPTMYARRAPRKLREALAIISRLGYAVERMKFEPVRQLPAGGGGE